MSELLLSRSDSDALVSRFRLEQRIRIGQDLERENEILCRYLEKGRLEFSFKSLLASAQGAVAIPLGTEDSGSDR